MNTETSTHRRKGHIARLPKALRDKVNSMLDDGATYGAIIEELNKSTNPPLPHPVTEDNVGTWKEGGYQDYLRNQQYLDEIRLRQYPSEDFAQNFDATSVGNATIQLGMLHVFESLRALGSGKLDLSNDPMAFARVMNSVARASRELMLLQKYQDANALARLKLQPLLDPERELTDSETKAIVSQVDKILGLSGPLPDLVSIGRDDRAVRGANNKTICSNVTSSVPPSSALNTQPSTNN